MTAAQSSQATPFLSGRVSPLALESFCTADDDGQWLRRERVGGHIFLHFSHGVLICSDNGDCFSIGAGQPASALDAATLLAA